MSGNENKSITRKQLKEQIIKIAQADQAFKKALVENPKGAIGQLGVQLPEDVEVKVVEESAGVVYLVLPVNPDELTDEQLEVVAGGAGCSDQDVYSYPICDPVYQNTTERIPRSG
ncbi:MAG: NHLP leader peptide family RiPP precursor [Peptococcaceae bacterium]|nr:NHLP leader peptide family RiPP precursor [Peptococcaceae bacterium]